MADTLSLAVAAPVGPALAGAPMPAEGGIPALSTLTADPFAAFLATAQATPAILPGQPAAILAAKLPAMPVAESDTPVVESKAPIDSDTPDASVDPAATPVVDATLSPALAMLSALAMPEPGAPRPQPTVATPRSDGAAKPILRAVTARSIAAAPAPAAAILAATTSPQTLAIAVSMAIPTEIDAATLAATVPDEAPNPAPILADRESQPSAGPLPFAPPAQTPVAAPTPKSDPVPTLPIAQAVVAGTTKSPKPSSTIVADSAALPEAESVIVAETMVPTDVQAARPIKGRAIEPRAPRGKDAEAAPVAAPADRTRPVTPPLRAAASVARHGVPAEPIVAPPIAVAVDTPRASAGPQAPATDPLVQRQLIIADDGRWLDSLARDIAKSASGDTMQFRLEPANLGSLTVAIAQGSDGAAIRMTAETHRARDLLVEAQPALVAEARANGLRISETHVDLGNAPRDGGSNGSATPTGGQASFANSSAGQQAMRQDGNARRQPDLPQNLPNQRRTTAADAPQRDSGERFA